jgi:hypothetical protein
MFESTGLCNAPHITHHLYIKHVKLNKLNSLSQPYFGLATRWGMKEDSS